MSEEVERFVKAVEAVKTQRRKSVWQVEARRLLQAEMTLHGYSYKSLARALGGAESDQSLMTRINRGTFSMAFFLEVVRAMGTKTVDISHLPMREER